MSCIIGIDLGTTNSCVVVLDGGDTVVVPNAEGARTTPSVVAFSDEELVLVGQQAKRQAAINPQRTVQYAKRFVGRRLSEISDDVRAESGSTLIEHSNGDCWFSVEGKEMSPQEISAIILSRLKQTAEDYLGETVSEAVITVPAYFNDSQRQATRDAGKLAGLNVRRIINEPTAAALAYGVDRVKNATIAVFDLGGGTFDVSILKVQRGLFEVMSTAGDTTLGGEDFDRVILHHLLEVFERDAGVPIDGDRMALQRLKEAAETAKCELSTLSSTNVNLPFLAVDDGGPKHLNYTLSRKTLNELCADLVAQLEGPCKEAMNSAGVTSNQIDEVLLVGGMTRMPIVQETVERIFGKRPSKGINPDEAVAIGAAIQGGILGGEVKDVVLLDVTPQALGIRVQGNRMSSVIPPNTTIPVQQKKIFATTEDHQSEVVLHVLQGSSLNAADNHVLGTFTLSGLRALPAGQAKVEVCFEINADGIVDVTAVDPDTGNRREIRITHAHGLDAEEFASANARVRSQAKLVST